MRHAEAKFNDLLFEDPKLRNAAGVLGGVDHLLLYADEALVDDVMNRAKVDKHATDVVKVNRKISKARALVRSNFSKDGHTFACLCVQRWFTIGLGTLIQEQVPLTTATCADGKTALMHLVEECVRQCSPAVAISCVHADRKLFLMALKQ